MKNTRTVRIAAGTVCLIVVALVMGWFVGRYIPGDPREPEPRIGDGLYSETGYGLSKIVDFDPGSTMKLRNITQGQRYVRHPDEVERTPSELVDFYKENGEWEYECPDIDLSVSEIKTITTKGFAEWYPEYAGTYRPVYDGSELIAVTVTITNASDNLIQQWYKLPLEHVTLWSENLDYIDDSLGAGVVLDDAFVFANENYNRDELLRIEPGESQTLILPFKVNKNALKAQNSFDELDPSDFCIQMVDFSSSTAYRLWL